MDPATLVAQAVTLLSPYLAEAAKKVAGNVGEAAWKQAATLYQSLKTRLSGHPADALDDLAKTPEDPDTQATLRQALKKLIDNDPGFAKELAALLPPPKESGGDTVFNTKIGGNVSTLSQIAGSVQNLTIGAPPPPDKPAKPQA